MVIIIVEDEMASQDYIRQLLQKHFPSADVAACADNVPDAINAIACFDPDIVFVDINIKMGTGFDVLAAIPNIRARIIFTTAFDQYAVSAFQYHAVDYLLKPLEEKRFCEAVIHCISDIELKSNKKQLAELLQYMQQPVRRQQRLAIHTVDGIEFIDQDDILYAEAKGNYTLLKLKGDPKVVISKKLKEIEDILPLHVFFRIHHSYIVNLGHIKKYYRGRGGYIILSNGASLPVSSARKDEFLKHLRIE